MTTTYSPKDEKINQKMYDEYRQDGAVDGWDDPDKYHNFAMLVKIKDYETRSLRDSVCLDVGCGSGDFAGYLHQFSIGRYVGVDLMEKSLSDAKEKYPTANFLQGEFLKMKFSEQFDFVFCSGTFTTRLSTDNYAVLESAIAKMWKLTKHAVAFNFLVDQGRKLGTDEVHMFFYDLEKVLNICQKVAPDAKIHHVTDSTGHDPDYTQGHIYLIR